MEEKIILIDNGEKVEIIINQTHIEDIVLKYEIERTAGSSLLKISIPLDKVNIKTETLCKNMSC